MLTHLRRHFFAIVLTLVFALAGSLISTNRFLQFDSFYYDFGIYDQAIWRVSQFEAPIIDHFNVGGHWILGDHFEPALFLLSPLYWFTDSQLIILIAQAVFVAVSGYLLYLTARKMTQSTWAALCVELVYFLFAGLQNAILTDFHTVVIATVPIALMFYAFAHDKKKLYIIATIWFLLHKESSFLIASGIQAYVFFTRPKWRKLAFTLGLGGVIYSYLVIKLVIPAFSGQFQYDITGDKTLLSAFYLLFTPSIKAKTVIDSFASFSFTPLLTPLLWPTYLFHYAGRFLSIAGTRWDLGFHYNAEIAPVYAFSLTLFLAKFRKNGKLPLVYLGIIIIAIATYLNYFSFKRPFALAYNRALYAATPRTEEIRNYLANLPDDEVIMTQNHLAAHLSHKDVILLRNGYHDFDPMYVLFDTNPDQNPNNWYGVDPERFLPMITSDPNYELVETVSSYQLYQKISR